jgi:hypothetical protein
MKLRLLFTFLILCSFGVTYYVIVVKRDFEVLTNPEGPDTSDYFIEEGESSNEVYKL